MRRKILAMMIAVSMTIGFIPAAAVRADDPVSSSGTENKWSKYYDIETIDESKTYEGKGCTISTEHYAKYVVLKGDTDAVKKINKALKKAAKAAMENNSINENAQYAAENADYEGEETFSDYTTSDISFMNKKVVSVAFLSYWYSGGVSNINEYGMTFDRTTGKQIKSIAKVTKETSIKKIKKTLKKKINKSDYAFNDKDVEKEFDDMKASDFNYYIMKNGKVCVCFGPYELGWGGWTKTFVLAGKYQK